MTPPAEARIVYTPALVVIPEYTVYSIDVNHDGIFDFKVLNSSTPAIYTAGTLARRKRSPYNLRSAGVEGHVCCTLYALPPGAQISAKKSFLYLATFNMNWPNHKARYTGLQFQIKGRTHYGWARFTIDRSGHGNTVILTGYAYETIANKPIIAGRTHGTENAAQSMTMSVAPPQPVTLGVLAQGSSALSAWRGRE